jgi:class 3 adenylate cyclase
MGARGSTAVTPVADGMGKVANTPGGKPGKGQPAKAKVPVASVERNAVQFRRWLDSRNANTLDGALAFVPWVIQQSFREGTLNNGDVVVHRGEGAVVFSDASGFTALTERLALKSNGAELLSQCLMSFFTPLIDIIVAYRGDVIKFSGDALTIYYPAVDDVKKLGSHPPHGSFGFADLGPMATSVLRGSASCIEIHRRLHMFDTGVDGVKLCLHIGVGCGEVSVLQVGGVIPPETHVPRYEYVVAGGPLEQISVAEPLAKNGETVLSPQAWSYVSNCVIEGAPIPENPSYHQLARMDETKYTFPTIKNAAMEADDREEYKFGLGQLDVLRRYIPSAVFKQIQGGTLTYVNEMRSISVIFIQVQGVEVSSREGSLVAQQLMAGVQKCTYAHEGTLNKFLVDDKGLLFLLVFGLPPMVHMDDPTRAVLCCHDLVTLLTRLKLGGRFGITTGRNYCGVVGSASRMEYTVLGDTVNLSARLMANAPPLGVLCDETTRNLTKGEINCVALPPIKVKGKSALIPIFKPVALEPREHIGVGAPGDAAEVHFPWNPESSSLGGRSKLTELRCWREVAFVRHLLGEGGAAPLPKAGSARGTLKAGASPATAGTRPVDKTLFSKGGIITLCGQPGLGQTELMEYIAVHSASQHNMLPIFGTIGPRPNARTRPLRELIVSSVAALRRIDMSLPRNDTDALGHIAPAEVSGSAGFIGAILSGEVDNEDETVFEKGLDLARAVVHKVLERRPALVSLGLDTGCNLYDKTSSVDVSAFWKIVSTLTEFAKQGSDGNRKPLVLVISCKDPRKEHEAIQLSLNHGWYLETQPLTDEGVTEYMSKCLDVQEKQVPKPLADFVGKITLGNALYIREAIDQLMQHGHIEIFRTTTGAAEGLYYNHDLESITIAEWAHTAMVGNTICTLESLDPLQAAVVKMATVFNGCFTVGDLISSCCSRWSGATCLDAVRLFYSLQTVVKHGIVDTGLPTQVEMSVSCGGESDFYRLDNLLVRKVAGAMVLDQQKKAIKRQALMDRCLTKDLPARMEALKKRKMIPHIPWYYQVHVNEPNRRGTYILGHY